MLDITKVLTIASYHVTKETAEKLSDKKWTCCHISIFDKGDYGWWIWIPEDYWYYNIGVPKDLDACIKLAIKHGCTWLCLDCDAMEAEELPFYDWEIN